MQQVCISSATAVVVNAAPSAPAAPTAFCYLTNHLCTRQQAPLRVTAPAPAAGISYSIDGTTYTNTTGVFNSVAPGNYNVTVKNAAGCISSATAATCDAGTFCTCSTNVIGHITNDVCQQAQGTITVSAPAPAAGNKLFY
jgi:hypothetical protein